MQSLIQEVLDLTCDLFRKNEETAEQTNRLMAMEAELRYLSKKD